MILWRSRGSRSCLFIFRSARTIMGFALTGFLYHWVLEGHDLQEWLFPFLFTVAVGTAWVAGPPIGWAISAIYMMIQGWGSLLLSDFQFFHGQDFFLWSLGQQETIALTMIFSAYMLLGGLFGWLSAAIGSWLVARIAMRFDSRSP
jgi:hypothetical protein